MLLHAKRSIAFIMVLLVFLSACDSLGSDAQTEPEAVYTAAAQTLDAQLAVAQTEIAKQTQAALDEEMTQAAEKTRDAAATPSMTATTEKPTPTETSAISPDPVLITNQETNCRSGPGVVYDFIIMLPLEEEIKVIGRSKSDDWWKVELSDPAGLTCWVWWAENLELAGNVFSVPYLKAPPLPTSTPWDTDPPPFRAFLVNTHDCRGNAHATFEVVNNSTDTYESARVSIIVPDVQTLSVNDGNSIFLSSAGGCSGGNSSLPPGGRAYLVGDIRGAPAGITLRAKITLCTGDGLSGTCTVWRVFFTL